MHPTSCSCLFALAVSAKACLGHTDGTAGTHCAKPAVLANQQHAAPPMMHSRNLNPYVTSAFEEWLNNQVVPSVPKECAVWSAPPGSLAACSSFGMSGVNAHALLSAPYRDASINTPTFWLRHRRWPILGLHHMLLATSYDSLQYTSRLVKGCHRCGI